MNKRQDILDATLDLIIEEGLPAVTFAKIFKKAGVGSGTVYNYFHSKEELIAQLYRESRQHLGSHALMNYDAAAGLHLRFRCLAWNILIFAIRYPKEFLFIDSYSYSASIPREIRDMEDPASAEFFKIMAEGQRQGILREMDTMMCFEIVYGIISTIAKGFFAHKYPLDDVQIQQTLESCWKAITV
jgi:TetR/AcrR family transcriptional regulator, repressor of fatR-cypB operon